MWLSMYAVLLLSSHLLLASADITGQTPYPQACLCATGAGVNVRATACGTVVGTISTGQCFLYRGGNTECTLSGTVYHFFELDYQGGSGWVAGTYLEYASGTQICPTAPPPASEFRALFMATVNNIDWPTSSSDSPATQQQQMLTYLDMMRDTNMNALVFQVRTSGDAFYASNIEPWSRYLTGTQGEAPDPLWDPLEYTVTEAHNRGIEVHAWLNPYRANLAANTNGLAPNHMCLVYSEYCYPYGSYMWMDPGAVVSVDRLVLVVHDILTRYNVDGIHFDDYFYPYPVDGVDFPDDSTWAYYQSTCGASCLTRENWRRDNVNRMVERVYTEIKTRFPTKKFSISPFGIYRPCQPDGMPCTISGMDPYTELYADSKLWLQNGWVDMFAPQIYWAIEPPAQSYTAILDWWLSVNTLNRQIYGATGVYKMSDSNNWAVNEIVRQVAETRIRQPSLSLGNIHYSAKFFRDNVKGIRDEFQQSVYTNVAAVP